MEKALAARRKEELGPDPGLGTGAVLVSPGGSAMYKGTAAIPTQVTALPSVNGFQEHKDLHSLHAEIDALIEAKQNVYGWTIFVTKFPCGPCASALIRAGVKRVVAFAPETGSRWFASQIAALDAFFIAGVVVDIYDPEDYV